MYSSDRTISPVLLGSESALGKAPSASFSCPESPVRSPRFIPLSLRALRERIILLTDIGLPCLVTVGGDGGFVALTLLVGWRDLQGGDLCLVGDRFSVALRRREIGSIQVVYQDTPEQSLAVLVQDHVGGLIASLVGMPSPCEDAVWADVMGNPCYTADERS